MNEFILPGPAPIDLSQAHSLHDQSTGESSFTVKMGGGTASPIQLEALRNGLVAAVTDLQEATKTAFTQYDLKTEQYFSQINTQMTAVFTEMEKLELVMDSLVKLFVLADQMPPEAMLEHQTVIADFLKRSHD